MAKQEKDVEDVVKERYKEAKEDIKDQVLDAEQMLKDKGLELRRFLKDIKAVLEEWKFSVEESKEGVRVEIRAVALIKVPKRGEAEEG